MVCVFQRRRLVSPRKWLWHKVALRGCVYPDHGFTKDFIEHYIKRYGVEPAIGSGNGYDAMKLLDYALSIVKDPKQHEHLNQVLRVKDLKAYWGAILLPLMKITDLTCRLS